MRWPWQNRETRTGDGSGSSGSYTDTVVAAIMATVGGNTLAIPGATAAAEMASGIACKAFQSADVDGASEIVRDALTADVRGLIAREMCRRGQAVLRIRVGSGRLFLDPATETTITGAYDPEMWQYQTTLAGPSETHTVSGLSPASVVHCRYAYDAAQPWQGIGPLQSATLASRLCAALAGALADEAGGPRGYLLPIPPGKDGQDETVADLKADLAKLDGGLQLVESMAMNWDGRTGGGSTGWDAKRLGADVPATSIALQELATREVLSAFGLSPALWGASDGTASREAYRQFQHGFLSPLARIVETELRTKLDSPDLTLDFSRLQAADISAKARSYGVLIKAGADPNKAAKAASLTGLITEETT